MDEPVMRLIYDPEADAANIKLIDPIQPGGVARSVICDDDALTDCAIILDFDAADRLIAIEVLGASKLLPSELLDTTDDRID
jgi:uncharacterized protein YuzE